jgi:hypothetical protein
VKQRVHEPLAETLRRPSAILLVSCYELGHQPLGLASPLGFLPVPGSRMVLAWHQAWHPGLCLRGRFA